MQPQSLPSSQSQAPPAASDAASRQPPSQAPSAPARASVGSTPDKRASHNATERARRDSLNARFDVLASRIPAISEVRRPSKALIVNRSLQFVDDSLARERMYRTLLSDLHDRTRFLTDQLNDLRVANGLHSYVETVPDLVLPVALADAPREKATRAARTPATEEEDPFEVDEPWAPLPLPASFTPTSAASADAFAPHPLPSTSTHQLVPLASAPASGLPMASTGPAVQSPGHIFPPFSLSPELGGPWSHQFPAN